MAGFDGYTVKTAINCHGPRLRATQVGYQKSIKKSPARHLERLLLIEDG